MLTIRFDPRIIVLAGLGLVVLGAFLPWINLPVVVGGELGRWGLAGAGLLTLGLGVLGLLSLLLPWQLAGCAALPAALLALLSYAAAMLSTVSIVAGFQKLSLSPSAYPAAIGSGLYTSLAGTLLALAGGLWPASGRPSGAGQRLHWLALAACLASLPVMCVCAALAGTLVALAPGLSLGSGEPGPGVQPTPQALPAELVSTPLVDVRITLWDVTPQAVLPTPPSPTPNTTVPTASSTPRPSPMPTHTTPPSPTPPPPSSPLATPTSQVQPFTPAPPGGQLGHIEMRQALGHAAQGRA